MTTRPIEIYAKVSGTGADLTIRTLYPFGSPETGYAIEQMLAAGGVDPYSLNRISWPIVGISRWSTARVLMYRDDVDTLAASLTDGGISGGPLLFCTLKIGTATFPQMTVGETIPVCVGEQMKSLCVVELHDRRWLWRHYRVQPSTGLATSYFSEGFNSTGVHRGRWRKESLSAGSLWTASEIVDYVRDTNGASPWDFMYVAANDEWDATDASAGYGTQNVYDVSGEDSAPGAIDKVMMKCGSVLTVVPKLSGSTGLSFNVRSIADEDRAAAFYAAKTDELLAGGLDFLSADASPPSTGAAKWAYVNAGIVRRDCPEAVRVHFPLSVTDGSDDVLKECARDDCADSSVEASRASIGSQKSVAREAWESSSGRPSFSGGGSVSPALYHIVSDFPAITKNNAVAADLIDTTRTSDMATLAANCFFSRYRAGCGDGFFRDSIQPLKTEVWAGAQWWEIIKSPHPTIGEGKSLPITRIWGRRHCELFGYQPLDAPIAVHACGTVLAFHGPDGAIKVVGQHLGGIKRKARLTGATPIGGTDFRWDYDGNLLQLEAGEWIAGEAVTIRNGLENGNTASIVNGSVKWPLEVPGTWQVLPIGMDRSGVYHETEVEVTIWEDRLASGAKVIEFCLPLTIDGGCE